MDILAKDSTGKHYNVEVYFLELAKGVKHFKEEEGGRKIMREAVEKCAERKAESVRQNSLL